MSDTATRTTLGNTPPRRHRHRWRCAVAVMLVASGCLEVPTLPPVPVSRCNVTGRTTSLAFADTMTLRAAAVDAEFRF